MLSVKLGNPSIRKLIINETYLHSESTAIAILRGTQFRVIDEFVLRLTASHSLNDRSTLDMHDFGMETLPLDYLTRASIELQDFHRIDHILHILVLFESITQRRGLSVKVYGREPVIPGLRAHGALVLVEPGVWHVRF
jgi:hypothetical protein